jgi:hypothetical protein
MTVSRASFRPGQLAPGRVEWVDDDAVDDAEEDEGERTRIFSRPEVHVLPPAPARHRFVVVTVDVVPPTPLDPAPASASGLVRAVQVTLVGVLLGIICSASVLALIGR